MHSVPLVLPPTVASYTYVWNWYLISAIIAGGFVIGLLLFVAVKYRDRKGAPPPSKGPESIWIAVAVVVIMALALFAAGYQTFAAAGNLEIPDNPNAVTIHVTGFQWGWNFTYPDGHYVIGNLTVPANTVIIMNITSRDVYHDFGIPMLDVKEDAIPGKVNQLWFEVPSTGVYVDAIHCFELCGIGHAFMMANLTVVSQNAWNKWMGSG